MDHSKTILLSGAHCKNECFLRYCSYYMSVSTVLCYPNKLCYFLWLNWNFFFLGISHLNYEMTSNLYVCVCVIVSLCDSVIMWFCDRFVCQALLMSPFLCLNIFQSAPILVQILITTIPRDDFCFFRILNFYGSYRFFHFYGT